MKKYMYLGLLNMAIFLISPSVFSQTSIGVYIGSPALTPGGSPCPPGTPVYLAVGMSEVIHVSTGAWVKAPKGLVGCNKIVGMADPKTLATQVIAADKVCAKLSDEGAAKQCGPTDWQCDPTICPARPDQSKGGNAIAKNQF